MSSFGQSFELEHRYVAWLWWMLFPALLFFLTAGLAVLSIVFFLLPPPTSFIVVALLVGLLVWKLFQYVKAHLERKPLTLNNKGVTVFDSDRIYWSEISEITIKRFKGVPTLVFKLTEAATHTHERSFFWLKMPKRFLTLQLSFALWDKDELVEAIGHFYLDKQDPVAAKNLRLGGVTGKINE